MADRNVVPACPFRAPRDEVLRTPWLEPPPRLEPPPPPIPESIRREMLTEEAHTLAAGADMDAKNDSSRTQEIFRTDYSIYKGRTALLLAVETGQEAVALALLRASWFDDLHLWKRFDRNQSTLMHLAAFKGLEALTLALLRAGEDKDATDNDGSTPLHLAAAHGHQALALALVRAGARKDVTNKAGDTPLLLATKNGHEATALVLIERFCPSLWGRSWATFAQVLVAILFWVGFVIIIKLMEKERGRWSEACVVYFYGVTVMMMLPTVMVQARLVKSFGDWVHSTHPPHSAVSTDAAFWLIVVVGFTVGAPVGVRVFGWMDVLFYAHSLSLSLSL